MPQPTRASVSYERELGEALFENWKAVLKWQRLRPYEKFVGGLNNKIRILQRCGYAGFEMKNICVLLFELARV